MKNSTNNTQNTIANALNSAVLNDKDLGVKMATLHSTMRDGKNCIRIMAIEILKRFNLATIDKTQQGYFAVQPVNQFITALEIGGYPTEKAKDFFKYYCNLQNDDEIEGRLKARKEKTVILDGAVYDEALSINPLEYGKVKKEKAKAVLLSIDEVYLTFIKSVKSKIEKAKSEGVAIEVNERLAKELGLLKIEGIKIITPKD